MENQTRIGIGATAFFALFAWAATVIGWWAVPFMVVCAAVGVWGFWSWIALAKPQRLWRQRIPIHEAALIAYEAAERAGVVDMTTHPATAPEARLKFYIYVFYSDDEAILYGAKPPSTRSLPIPRQEYMESSLYPVDGESRLDYLSPRRVGYVNVTIRRRDLNRIIQEWPAKSKDFARNYAKTLK